MSMNWACPHQSEDKCTKLGKSCYPAQAGFVLKGKARLVSQPGCNPQSAIRKQRKETNQ